MGRERTKRTKRTRLPEGERRTGGYLRMVDHRCEHCQKSNLSEHFDFGICNCPCKMLHPDDESCDINAPATQIVQVGIPGQEPHELHVCANCVTAIQSALTKVTGDGA